jgi:hypothetical protein
LPTLLMLHRHSRTRWPIAGAWWWMIRHDRPFLFVLCYPSLLSSRLKPQHSPKPKQDGLIDGRYVMVLRWMKCFKIRIKWMEDPDFVIEKDVLTHSCTLMQPSRRAALALFSPTCSALALEDIFLSSYTRVRIPTVAQDQFSISRAIMSSPANADSEGSSFKPFTKAERIQQLSDIDKAR